MNWIELVVVAAVVGGSVVSLVRWVMRSREQRRLLRSGATAAGRIVSAARTGTFVNEQPELKLGVIVHLPDGHTRQIAVTQVVDMLDLSRAQAGANVTVRYDPARPDHAVIAFDAAPDEAAARPPTDLEVNAGELLMAQQELQDELEKTGASAAAVVQEIKPLPVDLNNGAGVLVLLKAAVKPDDAVAFTAEFPAALARERLPKYQPGERIWVRYDREHPSRVALDWVKQHGTVSRA